MHETMNFNDYVKEELHQYEVHFDMDDAVAASQTADPRGRSDPLEPMQLGEQGAAEHGGAGQLDRCLQLADRAGRREVLVLVGDPHDIDPFRRCEPAEDRLDELLGRVP